MTTRVSEIVAFFKECAGGKLDIDVISPTETEVWDRDSNWSFTVEELLWMLDGTQVALTNLARARMYQMDKDLVAPGRAQAALRQDILSAPPRPDLEPEVIATYRRLLDVGVDDMPASADDLALLIDTICMRHHLVARADAWRKIGVLPQTGRHILGRNAHAITWPVFFAARYEALGK